MCLSALQSLKQVKPAATMMKSGSIGTDWSNTIPLAIKRDPIVLKSTAQLTDLRRDLERLLVASPRKHCPTHYIILRGILIILLNDGVIGVL